MKIKKIVRSLLISALLLGGLSVAATSVNARHIRYHHVRTHRTVYRIRRPIHRYRPRIRYRQPRTRTVHWLRMSHRHVRWHRSQRHNSSRPRVKRAVHQAKPKRPIKSQKPTRRKRNVNQFQTVNNHTRDLKNAKWESFGNGRRETVKSYAGPKVQFKTLRFLPAHIGGTHFVQSITVTPSGHYAFVGCDAYPYLSGYTKIARVDLYRKNNGIKVGPRFYGGHGQALAYNQKDHQLWLLVDPSGPLNRGTFDEISTNTLKPIRHVHFHMHHTNLGDVLTFDNQGNAYNENRIWYWDTTSKYHRGNIILYKGQLNHRQAKFNEIMQGIRKAPGYIIQGIAYNNRTKRLYIETDDAIMSIPDQKLGKLKPHDVKETILHGHREYEGISFDRSGHAYIMMARPNEILKSTRVF